LHNCAARFASVCAGVRSGKSYGAAREFMRRVYADRFAKSGPLRYWAVAPTYDLADVQQREIADILQGSAGTLIKAQRKTERSLELTGEILIEFKSAHHYERLVGVGLDGVWIDEAARLHPETWRGQIRMRLSDHLGWGLFSTTPLSRNWFYNEIWRRGDPHDELFDPAWASVHFTTAQNTALPGLAAEVEQARRDLPSRYFVREYMASFDAFVGQIYEEFNRNIHVVRKSDLPKTFQEIRVGVDWGFRNPGAMIVIGRDGDDSWWAIEEIVREKTWVDSSNTGATWLSLAHDINTRLRPSVFLCDPSGPESIRAFRAAGLPARGADNRVSLGIQRIAMLLHAGDDPPRLRFADTLTHLITEIQGYRWREDDPLSEEPVKENDHALDALRYALSAKPHKPAWW
jgi:Terminase large subunit, T4likevirus-type, N-terminal